MELMQDIVLPFVAGGIIGIMYGEVRRALILRSESRERRRAGEPVVNIMDSEREERMRHLIDVLDDNTSKDKRG